MRRIATVVLLLSGMIACGPIAAAEADTILDEISVTATRAADGIARKLLGASLTIIDAEEMESRHTRVLSDLLRDVPGVAVSRFGAEGGQTQVRIRGSEANHTLVLVDGVKASDPYYDEFDFATLIADDVASVEVLRGQQSALYGSDAIGGVISYRTLTGREAPGLSARVEGGSFTTFDASVRYGAVAGSTDYALSAGWRTTDGYPVARVGSRDIGSENFAASGRFNVDVSDVLRISTMLRANRTEADSADEDYSFGTPEFGAIDGTGSFTNRSVLGAVRAEYDAMEGRWKSAVSVQRTDVKRHGTGQFGPYGDKGTRMRYSLESTLGFGEQGSLQHLVTLAADRELTDATNTEAYSAAQGAEHGTGNTGIVAQYTLLANDRLGIGASLRQDNNTRFEDVTTYRVQASYLFDSGTRLRAASGSGVKNPSLTEVFGYDPEAYVGNPDLKPEKSRGWEVGLDQAFMDGRALLGATYFRSTLDNEIYTDSVFGPAPDFEYLYSTPGNRDTRSKQRGFEFFIEGLVLDDWRVTAAWTHVNASEDGTREIRRPANIGSLNIGWTSPAKAVDANVAVRYNGRMTDSNFYGVGPSPVPMQAFTLVNVNFNWHVTGTMQFYGRVENAFDEDYEEIYTYRAVGVGFHAGVRLRF